MDPLEEEFVDAQESLGGAGDDEQAAEGPPGDQLGGQLDQTIHVLRLALSNEFVRALDICGQRADDELYSALAHAALSFLRVALTLEQSDLQAAVASINRSLQVSDKYRRKQGLMLVRLIYHRPDYNQYTDLQAHAELVHAESLILVALISFLSDQSIICLVRSAFRIRACYQRYKECLQILETRQSWASEVARKHFESGVNMGLGIFNLLMSYLPRRVLRLLEYAGFSGRRSLGVDSLDRSVSLDDSLRSVFSALVILTYHSYVENLFGLGDYDAQKVHKLVTDKLGSYPTSAFFFLFRGRYHQMEGDLAEAIDNFQRCIEAQDDWKQFHSICHWEMMWCYAVQLDWKRAAHYSDLLRHNSKWSAASYTYQYGTFLYAQLMDEQRQGLCPQNSEQYSLRINQIRSIMELVPTLRIRYAGKTIPAEKFAITRAAKFCQQNNRLSMPALEFLYIWNIFATLRKSPTQVEQILNRIDEELEFVRGPQNHSNADSSTTAIITESTTTTSATTTATTKTTKTTSTNNDSQSAAKRQCDVESHSSGLSSGSSSTTSSTCDANHQLDEVELGPASSEPNALSAATTTNHHNGNHVSKDAVNDDGDDANVNDDDDDDEDDVDEQDDNDDEIADEETTSNAAPVTCVDDECQMLLLKGMCLKHLNRLGEAESCFREIFERQGDIQSDTFLVPHAVMELALLMVSRRDYTAAKQWIKTARNNYTGYLLETMVHFRLHAASRVIRCEQNGESSLENSTESSNSGAKLKK